MRQKLITLDPTSWDLAQKKSNFSDWVRIQLRIDRDCAQLVIERDQARAAIQVYIKTLADLQGAKE